MMRMELFSKEWPETGGMGAAGFKKLLSGQTHDMWVHFIRETIQNTWDAKKDQRTSQVEYSVHLRNYSSSEWKQIWTDIFNKKTPKAVKVKDNEGLDINDVEWGDLKPSGPRRMLIVSDRNTTGLGGVTLANDPKGEVARDFVQFMYDWGSPQDKDKGGGSFGYGKSVLYNASNAGTIIVYTRCHNEDGKLENRFIASALGAPETAVLLGNHWWGDRSKKSLRPMTGKAADKLAALAGFELREGDETGTTIGVTAPIIGKDISDSEFLKKLQIGRAHV